MDLAAVKPLSWYLDWNNVLPLLGIEYREPDDAAPGYFDSAGRVRFEDGAPTDPNLQYAPYREYSRALNLAGYADEGTPEDIAARAGLAEFGAGQKFSSAQEFLDYVRGAGSQLFYSEEQGRWLVKAGDPAKALNPTPVAMPNTIADGWRDFGINALKVVASVYSAGNLISSGLYAAGAEGVSAPPSFLDRFFSQAPAPVSDAVAVMNPGETLAPSFDLATPATAATWSSAGVDPAAFVDIGSEANEAAASAASSGYTGSAVTAAGTIATSAGPTIQAPTLSTAKTIAGTVTSGAAAVKALTGGTPMNPIQTPRYGSTVPTEGMQGGAPAKPNPIIAGGDMRTAAVAVAAGLALLYVLDKVQ